jgi:hypothetical protein
LGILVSPFKSKCRLEAENMALRHQVVLRRQARSRIQLTNLDRLFLVQLYRWIPSTLQVLSIVQPEMVIRWHRAGFATSTGSAGHAGANASSKLTFHLDHSMWAAQRAIDEAGYY